MICTRLLIQFISKTYQSGTPSQRNRTAKQLHRSLGHRKGSKAGHFFSVRNESSLQILDGFMMIIHELVLQDICVCNW